jgi:hypothetical protein
MNQILALLNKQPTRILSYIAAGVLIGSWLGNQYPAQTASFWGQPIVALCLAVATVMASIRKNKEREIENIAAKFMIPPAVATPQEQEILSKLAEQQRMDKPK